MRDWLNQSGILDEWHFKPAQQPSFSVAVGGSLMISNAFAIRTAVRIGLGVAI